MKKVISVITLIVMMGVNIMDPFTYAISLGDDFEEIQKFDEIVEDENFDDEEKIDDNGENNEILDIEQEDEDDINVGQDGVEIENLSGEGGDNGENGQENSLENIDEDGKEALEGNEDTEEVSQSTGTLLTDGENDILLEENEIEENKSDDNEGDTPIDVVNETVETEILGLTGNVDVLSGDIENLTGENVELTGIDLELGKARETLNTEVIQGTESSKNVVVYVEADIDTFPQGTQLQIKPIMVNNQLNEIKEQIKDSEKNVDDSSEIVAFDISFLYTLSDGSEKEIQPKNGEGVKVIFDYSDNKNLVKADENDEQEVKVFHLDDKDENGEKVAQGEEVVKDVTNIHESGEVGVVVVDAETFSIYAIVTTTSTSETISIIHNLNGGYWLEGSNPMVSRTIEYTCVNNSCTTTTNYRTPSKTGYMFMGWFDDEEGNTRWIGENAVDGDEVYAKWQEFGDLDVYILGSDTNNKYHYTLMDRNMGAKSKNTAGYYYQRGNNFGFTSGWGKTAEGKIDTSNYSGSNPYMNSTFYLNAGDGNGNWINPKNPNLWGGNSSNTGDRQGPCPDGYHIPTITEWDGAKSKWKTYYDTSRTYSAFYKDFLIVGAGYLARGTASMAAGDEAKRVRYATSTLNGNGLNAKIVKMLGSDGTSNNEPKTDAIEWSANGMSVRCFKNIINTSGTALDISDIHLDGGSKAIISIASGEVVSLQNPTKAGHDFIGWYTNDSYTGTAIGVGSGIEAGSSLYAKYDCAQGYVEVERECVPGFKVVFDANTNGGTSGDNVIIVTGSSSITLDLGDYTAEKEGYYFVGWNTNSGVDTGLQGEQTFTQKTTLYAIFLNLYTYTFVDEEGNILGTGYYQSGVVSDMNRLIPLEYYTNGKVADTSSYPALLTLGVGEGMGRRWIPELPKNGIATESLIITGEIDNAFTVTFLDGDGSSYLSYGVVSGSKIDYITGPEGEAGYQFVDWYEDAGLNVRFDFSTKTITGNTTIYPGFTEVLCTFTTENVTAGLKITGFSGTPTEECLTHFVIPSKIGGKIVKQIGYRAFKGKSISGEIILPDTVTYIGEEAFANNEISGKLKLPNNIENIDKNAFYNNKISGQLDLPESLTKVGIGAFATNNISGRLVIPGRINNGVVESEYRCNPIEEVIFGIGTTEITKEAFADHGSICNDSTKHTIKHVEFPSTLQIIRNQAFNGQIIEGELELPNSLTIVEDGAFGGNKISGILRIPGSVTTVTNAFNCNPIEEVVFGEGITKINGNAFNADCNNKKDGKIEKITLPSTLTSIGDRAFKFQSLTGELIIPNGVTSIGYEAFTANKNKIGGQLIIPDSVISIGYNAFENNQITGLILGSSLQTIGNYAFNRNQLTGELIIPNSVQTIGNYAFDGYNGNNRIGGQLVIPDSVTFIGQYAFRNNQITGVILGNGLGTIEAGIFQNNKVGGQLIIPDSVISIGYNAFENNQITGLILGSSLQTIGNYAFNRNQLTGELIIPNSVQTIGNYAFDGYNGNNRIGGQLVIPDSVTSIGECAFRSNQITGLILGNGLDTINTSVFYNNKIEGELIIPDSVIYIGQSSFQNNQITGLVLGRNVDTIRQDAFNQNKLEGELIIPDSVTFIGKQAFDGNNGGNKITGEFIIPNNVTYIGEYAFRSNQITSLKLGNSVETIRWNSFENNQIGGELIIPDSVTYIGECAFRSNQITGLVLGSGLNAIYKETFKNNQIEGEFIIPDDINTIGDEAFSNNKISGTLFIPGRINSGIVNNAFRANYLEKVIFGSGITYIKAYAFDGNGRTDLKRQIKSVEFPSTLTGIADYAFRQQRIECLELPDSLMNIGQYAFYQNKISGTLIIPDSVISIGRQSFDNQMSGSLYTLQSVVLGNNVQEVGYGAFLSNRNLKNVYIPDSVEILSGIVFSHNNNPYYTTGYVTTKKSTLDYTGAYIKPLYQLYSYTFVNENGDILGTGYYPEILESNTTKVIPLDYYNGIGNVEDFTGVDSLITPAEGYTVVWSESLSEHDVVTENLIVTGSIAALRSVMFKNPFTGDIVEYIPNNQYVSEPEEFIVEGYTFTGWYNGDVKVSFPLQITSDLILTGRYDINKYAVNFYEDEEQTTLLTGGVFDYNTVLDVENPQKAGKAFGGWYYLSGSEEVFVRLPVVVDKDMNLYAKWGNAVSIVFDANGGKFSDDSTQKTIVYAEDGVCGGSTTYSHTSNVNDNGEKISNEYGNYQNRTDVVTISGAKKLKVTITYQTEAINYDWVCVREGSHPEYSGSVDCTERLGGTTTGTKEYIIAGDTVTFGFKSDHNKNNYYGYYAIVTDVADYYTPIVEEPSREGLEFLGWYLDQSGNNPFVMSCDNRDKTVYAKRRGYTGWDGCYEYSTLGKDNNGDYIAEITAYSGATSCQKENLSITGTIVRNGRSYIVKKIGNSAFMSKGLSGTLTFPSSLNSIGGTAFAGNAITNLEIFPSIEHIGYYAFAGNSVPLNLVLHEGLTEIWSTAFASSNLTGEIVLPSTVLRVGSNAFQTNSYVKGITLNDGLIEIGSSAFGESYGLSGTSLVIPSSVKKIGGSAFNNINFSEIIILPYDVDIETYAFNAIGSNLNKLVINGLSGGVINGNVFYLSFVNLETLQLGTGITGINAGFRNSKITGLVIPDTVTSISSYAFQNNKDLKTIKLGTGLKILNDYVFSNCTGVEYVDLGNLEYIGGSNFQGTQMTGLVIPDSVISISSSAFRSNKKLKTIKIGTGLKTLNNSVFGNCTGIEYVDLGELENIYGGNFQNTQMTGLVIPDSVISIGNGTFADNTKLKTLKIGTGLKTLEVGVFPGCTGIETVDLGNLEYIGAANFSGTQITGLVIPDSVTGIDNKAFMNNTHLQTLILGNSVRYIGNSAFANSALTGVSLPNSLTNLGSSTFCIDNGTNTGTVIGFIGDNPSATAEQLEEQENTACFVIKRDSYTVTYDAGTNSGTIGGELTKEVYYPYGAIVSLTGVGAETAVSDKIGYNFIGWTDQQNGTGVIDSYTLDGRDVTLYAVFKKDAENFEAVFHANNASFSGTGETVLSLSCVASAVYNTQEQTGCLVTPPEVISPENTPNFLGWNTSSTSTGNNPDYNTTTNELTLRLSNGLTQDWYAITKAPEVQTYVVMHFNGNQTFSQASVIFVGNNVYNQGSEVISGVNTHRVTFNLCKIAATYNGNPQSDSCEVLTDIPTIISTGTKTALGWSATADTGSEILYTPGQENVTLTGYKLNPEIHLYAQSILTGKSYSVVFSGNGAKLGNNDEDEITLTCTGENSYNGEDETKSNQCDILSPIIPQVDDGYDFLGWQYLSGNEYIDAQFPITLTGNIRLYASRESSLVEELTGWDGCYQYRTHTGEVGGNVEYYAEITSYSGSASCPRENLTMPNVITRNGRNYEIREIGSAAFGGKNLSGVITLPSSLKVIKSAAFITNSNITSVVMSEGLVSIGTSAFQSITSLKSINFPSTLQSIEGSAFYLAGLESVNIPDSVVSIGGGAFANNANLKTVKIGEGLEVLDGGVFDNCTRIESVDLGSLKYIKARNFSGTQITGLVIPSSMTGMDTNAFMNNTQLKTVIIEPGLENLAAGVFNKSTGIEYVDLGSLKYIGPGNFSNTQITGLVIPSSMTGIAAGAFSYNSQLKTVIIEPGLEILSDYAFSNSTGIEYVDLGSLKYIGGSNFVNTQITGLVIPDSVTEMGYRAFYGNAKLKTLKIGSGLKNLNDEVFQRCSELETVDLGDGLETIGAAFYNDTNLKTIVRGNNVKTIQAGAFGNTAIEELILPDSVENLSGGAFAQNMKLKTVKLGTGLKNLTDGVFYNSIGIKYVDLGNVEYIGAGNFTNTQITGLVIPDSVTGINNGAFMDNKQLKTIKIGSGLKVLNNRVFEHCTGIEYVDLGNLEYIGADNFSGTQITGLVIPDSVTGIDNKAFIDNTHLQTLTLGNSVRYIGNSAFANSALTGVSLPNSLTTLGTGVFCTDNGTNTGTVIGFIGNYPSVSAEDLESQDDTACFVIKSSTYQVNIALTGENMGEFESDSATSGPKNYGQRFIIKVKPKLGYRFWKWEVDGDPVMTGAGEYFTGDLEIEVISGMNITGFFTGDMNTYTIRHRKQNIDNDDYSVVLLETGYGITDMQTNAEVKDFLGFTGLAFDQTGIKADGNTVVDIYYNRELYTITFFDSGSVVTGITAKYEKEITEPEVSEKAGYHFSGWYYDSGELCEFPIPMPLNGVNLTAQWIVNTGTEYRVEYYLQNEDLINYDFHLTGTQYGTSDTHGVALVKTFTGFEFNAVHTGNITSGTIVGDGSLVLRLFYDRKVYTISTGSNNETQGSVSVEGEPRYGKRLIFRANVIDSSLYKFVKWELNGRFVTTGESDDFWTGDLVIENLTGDVIVTGYFVAYSGCVWDGGTITHGTSVTGYFTPTVPYGQTCVSEIRICNDGTLSGTYQYASCTPEEPLSCALPWGGTTGHGAVVAGYKALSETCPAQCSTVSQVAICDNGNWNVENFTGIYTQPNCITQPVSTEGYDLDECPEYGICSSITGYVVNNNACIKGDEKYRLDGCEAHYHTGLDNESCEIDKFDIIWNYRNENGERTRKTINVEYGKNPTEPSLPLVSQTAQTGYTFTGWNPEVLEVTTGRIYTAQYDETIREYLIKFVDGNGIVIQSGMIAYGANPEYTGTETPTKTATPQYSYNFNYTWDPEIVPVTTGAEYIAQFNEVVNKYTIIWNNEDGILLEMDENVPYGTMPEYNGATPIKTGDEIGNYVFNGWTPTPVSVVGDAVYRAKYKEKETPEDGRKGNKWSGGGGGIEKSSDSYKNTGDIMIIENLVDGNQDSNIHGSALGENGEEIMVPLITKQNMRKYSELVINSYIWAFENGVTTVGEFDKANPEGYVLRGHLAKMMVNFSANVLGREIPIDIPVSCEWEDDSSEWESPEIKFYAKKACALGIMGIKVEKFEPNKTVSRAEFGTVLSRVLWGDKYDVRNPTRKNRYYARHLQILKEKGVMSQTENPLDRIELRKWIWVMLRRAQELK